MEKCPVCLDGRLMTKISSAGEETFCLDCRRITASSTLGFQFTAAAADEGIQACIINGRSGFKGPGDKAKCWLYDDGNEQQKKDAQRRARNSAYSAQHKKAASKIVNAVPYFTGGPAAAQAPMGAASMGAAPTGAAANAVKNAPNPQLQSAMMPGAQPNPQSPQQAQTFPQSPIGEVTAPGGMQPGNLNGPNPLNSGTTASTRLAELINDDIRAHMGAGFCTEHGIVDGCNQDQNSH